MDSIVPYLPFIPKDEARRRAMIEKIMDISGNFRNARYFLHEVSDFRKIFEPDGFQEAYDEFARLYRMTIDKARQLGVLVDADYESRLFFGIASGLFRGRTGREPDNNQSAYRIFLSLLARKKFEMNQQAQPKKPRQYRYRYSRPSRQTSLFH